jgi:hypothetical protein
MGRAHWNGFVARHSMEVSLPKSSTPTGAQRQMGEMQHCPD